MATIDDVRLNVVTFLTDIFPGHSMIDEGIVVFANDVCAFVTVRNWHETEGRECVIDIRVPLICVFDVNFKLYRWLVETNNEYYFGRFIIDESYIEPVIFITHTLVGDSWTQNELFNCLAAIMISGSQATDELMGVFGGVIWKDKYLRSET
jgi:hypothetical protein